MTFVRHHSHAPGDSMPLTDPNKLEYSGPIVLRLYEEHLAQNCCVGLFWGRQHQPRRWVYIFGIKLEEGFVVCLIPRLFGERGNGPRSTFWQRMFCHGAANMIVAFENGNQRRIVGIVR